MPHFVNKELNDELERKLKNKDKKEDKHDIFPEHVFVGTCLQARLTVDNLKSMTYVDIMKVLISLVPDTSEINNSKIKIRRATQEDMDKMRG